MTNEELLSYAKEGVVIGNGSQQIVLLVQRLDEMTSGVNVMKTHMEDTSQWWAVRWERLRKLIHDDACHIEDDACTVMANGTAGTFDPPKYDQILNQLRHGNAALQQRVDDAESVIDSINGLHDGAMGELRERNQELVQACQLARAAIETATEMGTAKSFGLAAAHKRLCEVLASTPIDDSPGNPVE